MEHAPHGGRERFVHPGDELVLPGVAGWNDEGSDEAFHQIVGGGLGGVRGGAPAGEAGEVGEFLVRGDGGACGAARCWRQRLLAAPGQHFARGAVEACAVREVLAQA